ncbi:MAG: hypothetical protein WC188_03775 [Candidatus Caldatribacteriota bacterium]
MQTQTTSLLEHFRSQKLEIKNIFKEFAKPIFNNVFFINLAALRLESEFYEFNNNNWSQRPTIFCMEIYEEPLLYPIILLVNNIKSFLEFVPNNLAITNSNQHVIIAPYRSIINKILSTSK